MLVIRGIARRIAIWMKRAAYKKGSTAMEATMRAVIMNPNGTSRLAEFAASAPKNHNATAP